MKTPVCDFINRYIRDRITRLHMPGHKGVGELERRDITEVDGADVLYHSKGILAQSQQNAAQLFGARRTVYSAEGSSLAIRAMVYLTRLYAGCRPVIAAARNAHKSFVTAAALLDADVRWIFPRQQSDILSCGITPEQLEEFLQNNTVCAVYVTSPDYLGNMADIQGLSRVCHQYGALLLVDNAHGAYLRFLPEDQHPVTLGADMCCDSAHKTLPVLTGGAYLHISAHAPAMLSQQADRAMSLFASTSPSYLILQSLDACNACLEAYPERLKAFLPRVRSLKDKLSAAGYALVGQEPLKITLAPKSYGYTGIELASILAEQALVCEFSDPDYLVMMLTPENTPGELERLEQVLLSVPRKASLSQRMPAMPCPEQGISMHEAILQAGRELPLQQCIGKLLASPSVSCPPAIPVLVCGERVSPEAASVLRYYGIDSLPVI